MKIIENIKNKKENYDLVKSVKINDIKTYLQEEYDRANKREDLINEYEKRFEQYRILEQKYDAMLVIQEKTSERTKKLDNKIEELNEVIGRKNDEIKILKGKLLDIETNSKNMLKEKNKEIRELKKKRK